LFAAGEESLVDKSTAYPLVADSSAILLARKKEAVSALGSYSASEKCHDSTDRELMNHKILEMAFPETTTKRGRELKTIGAQLAR
jgi:hypothetical protein